MISENYFIALLQYQKKLTEYELIKQKHAENVSLFIDLSIVLFDLRILTLNCLSKQLSYNKTIRSTSLVNLTYNIEYT